MPVIRSYPVLLCACAWFCRWRASDLAKPEEGVDLVGRVPCLPSTNYLSCSSKLGPAFLVLLQGHSRCSPLGISVIISASDGGGDMSTEKRLCSASRSPRIVKLSMRMHCYIAHQGAVRREPCTFCGRTSSRNNKAETGTVRTLSMARPAGQETCWKLDSMSFVSRGMRWCYCGGTMTPSL